MHPNFAEWYRIVSLEPDGTKLLKRWAGVKAWAAALHAQDDHVLETVRIFQGLPSKVPREPFLAAFRNQDAAFPQRNDLELQVLAGAALVECVQSNHQDDVRTAVLAGCAVEASALRLSEPRLAEVSAAVLDGLRAIAVERRRRVEFDAAAISVKTEAAVEGLKEVTAATTWEAFKASIGPVVQSLLASVQAADAQIAGAAHNLRCADEETSILWWLEGKCSRDLNKPWASLKEAVALLAGSELADLTDVALGLRDASALLERVLGEAKGKGKEAPLCAYVDALPDEWARLRVENAEERAFDLMPLTFAVSLRGKSDAASWQQFFDSASGLKASLALTPTRVARQAYVEAMLQRTLSDSNAEG